VTKVKPKINSVEVHPQLSNNGHPVDGWRAGGCWFTVARGQTVGGASESVTD
jgi:hypothetical protein